MCSRINPNHLSEPACRFGPGGDFVSYWPASDYKCETPLRRLGLWLERLIPALQRQPAPVGGYSVSLKTLSDALPLESRGPAKLRQYNSPGAWQPTRTINPGRQPGLFTEDDSAREISGRINPQRKNRRGGKSLPEVPPRQTLLFDN